MKSKYEVDVQLMVTIELDESAFTPEFQQQFNATIYPLQNVEDHVKHIAEQMVTHGYDSSLGASLEGYGMLEHMGIEIDVSFPSAEHVAKLR